MSTATAAVSREPGKPLVFEEIEISDPREGEVLVRVVGAGICHTDLIVAKGAFPLQPIVLGHEGAGVVEEVGPGVTNFVPGDRVAMSFASCRRCKRCLTGRPAYCAEFIGLNMAGRRPDGSATLTSGGEPIGGAFFGQSSFATHALAQGSNLVKLSDSVPLELVGPLGCGVQTGAGAVQNALRVEAGASLAVFGAGTVGLSALMAARLAGAGPLIAVDLHRSRLDLALELGATHVIDGRDPDLAEQIMDLTGGADYTIETTGLTSVVTTAVQVLGSGGVCGLHGLYTPNGSGTDVAAIPLGRTVAALIEGESVPQTMVPGLLELYAQGLFAFDKLVKQYAFEDINQAIADAESGATVKPVVVFDPA